MTSRIRTTLLLTAFVATTIPASIAVAQQTEEFQQLHNHYLQEYPFCPPDTLYTVESELTYPDGYRRPDSSELSDWSLWISHFPLWHRYKPIGDWRGARVAEPGEISRALYFPERGRHLLPAAIPLRLLAAYMLVRDRINDLAIIPKAGEQITFDKWLSGTYAFNARGEVIFKESDKRTPTTGEYLSMVKRAMEMTNCASLADNCVRIADTAVQPGDLYLSWDSESGEANVLILMYMLVNDDGERMFAVATGCADPCEPHIPYFTHDRNQPWITLDEIREVVPRHNNEGFYRLNAIANQ